MLKKLDTFVFETFKRTVDIIGGLFLMLLFSPVILITSLLVKFTSKGPIFFSQIRVGKNSKPFKMYKFRTMYTGDNDLRLKKYPELYKKYKKNGWKLSLREDPRLTQIGKIIRVLSLDEFPQFYNVVKGEMSLVGPRAYREEELLEYSKIFPHTKHLIDDIRSVKPGITGLWQTSGRNDVNFEQRAKLDSSYIRHRSIFQELKILFKTPFCMISRW